MALRTAYNTGSYDAGRYDRPEVFTSTAAPSLTSAVTTAASSIAVGVAAPTLTSTITSSGFRIGLGVAVPTLTSSVTIDYKRFRSVIISDSIVATISSHAVRIIKAALAAAISSIAETAGNYKWITGALSGSEVDTWTSQSKTTKTWTEQARR